MNYIYKKIYIQLNKITIWSIYATYDKSAVDLKYYYKLHIDYWNHKNILSFLKKEDFKKEYENFAWTITKITIIVDKVEKL